MKYIIMYIETAAKIKEMGRVRYKMQHGYLKWYKVRFNPPPPKPLSFLQISVLFAAAYWLDPYRIFCFCTLAVH
jgi:hypothetical protein